MVNAIETKYKGYRFRSRLEARWAVFFDALRIQWKYEPEGFKLHSGLYLPDFFLPQVCDRRCKPGVWVEIKGVVPSGEESALCGELADATKTSVVMLVGPPEIEPYGPDSGYQWTREEEFTSWDDCMALHYCTRCRAGDATKFQFMNDYFKCPKCGGDDCTYDNPFIKNAAEDARSARFEHGETPRGGR